MSVALNKYSIIKEDTIEMPSHDYVAEAYVVSAILNDGNAEMLERVRAHIDAPDFFIDDYRAVFSAAVACVEQGKPIDFTSIHGVLTSRNYLGDIERFDVLTGLSRDFVHSINIETHARTVADHARNRKVTELARALETNIRHGNRSATRVLADHAQQIASLADVGQDQADDIEIHDPFPMMPEEAFYGIAGEIVSRADPHTESDRAAVLAQFLTAFGNIIGSNAHFMVGATKHALKIFLVLVGLTAMGRKGSSWDIVKFILKKHDELWALDCVPSGLSSGEGLIHHVRDPVVEERPVRAGKGKTGPETTTERVVVDVGAKDKRACVIETELARTFKAMGRESNPLSDVLRQAWDGDVLRVMTKNSPCQATGAHISIIGHITREDLLSHLKRADSANGFANRFAWLSVRRSKELPSGGRITDVDWSDIDERMREIIKHARTVREMRRDAEAEALWEAVYPTLSGGKPGLLGAILSRAEPMVYRWACLYALLDGEKVVRAPHLIAALALWDGIEASTRFIFGNTHGDTDADKLLNALRNSEDGLTRKQITVGVFGRNRKREQIADLLTSFLAGGMAHCLKDNSTGGRPTERWYAGRAPKRTN